MPRWVFLLGVGLLLVAGAFLVMCEVLGPSPGITEANVRRIKPGISFAEVEAILGSSPDISGDSVKGKDFNRWTGPEGRAYVVSNRGCVIEVNWTSHIRRPRRNRPSQLGLLDRVRSLFNP